MVLPFFCISSRKRRYNLITLPMTPDIQPYGVLHIGVDNYFSKEKTGEPYFRRHLAALQFSIFPNASFASCNGNLHPAKNNYINSKS